jgi:hypothetical protein
MFRFAKLLLPLLVLMLAACQQNDEQKAEQLARKFMTEAIGANAVNRAHVEIRSSEAGWQVIFRDTYASCGEGSFWPGACSFGPRTFRDVYACVDPNWMIHELGASSATDSVREQDVYHAMPSGPTIAPAPTEPARETQTPTQP